MKVKIGPYKTWWGPYQIAQLIPFVSEDTHDKVGEFLANTWLNDICEWINNFGGNQKIKVRIDKYDTWNMDRTLAHIIIPMLKQLKETKHGSAMVDDEDLPPHMQHGDPYGDDNWVHYRWEWVLKEMIWAFENLTDDSWEDQFVHGTPIYVDTLLDDDGNYYQQPQIKQTNPDYWVDREGIKEYNNRISNGFRLFGKYYRSLWD